MTLIPTQDVAVPSARSRVRVPVIANCPFAVTPLEGERIFSLGVTSTAGAGSMAFTVPPNSTTNPDGKFAYQLESMDGQSEPRRSFH